MGDYVARLPEMMKTLQGFRPELIAEDREREKQSGGKDRVDPARYDDPLFFPGLALSSTLALYADSRERALVEALELLKPQSDDDRERVRARWERHFADRAQAALQPLRAVAERERDAIERCLDILALQESLAFMALGGLPIAGLCGWLRANVRGMETAAADLRVAWRDLASMEERTDSQKIQLRLKVLETLKASIEEIRSFDARLDGKLQVLLAAFNAKENADPEPSVTSGAAEVSSNTAAFLLTMRTTLDALIRASQDDFAVDSRILDMFANIRAQLADYLQKVNHRTMDDAFRADAALSRAAIERLVTEGQKIDLRLFAERVIAIAQNDFAVFAAAWTRFYDEFDGTFTGPIKESTRDILIEENFFQSLASEIDALAPGRFFEEAESRIGTVRRFSDLDDRQMLIVEMAVKARVESLKQELRRMDDSYFELFLRHYIRVPLGLARDKLSRMAGYIR